MEVLGHSPWARSLGKDLEELWTPPEPTSWRTVYLGAVVFPGVVKRVSQEGHGVVLVVLWLPTAVS